PQYGIVTAAITLCTACVVAMIGGLRSRRAAAAMLLPLALAWTRETAARTPGAVHVVELPTPAAVIEQQFTFERRGLTLVGTLAMPTEPAGMIAIVLMVAGSDPPTAMEMAR